MLELLHLGSALIPRQFACREKVEAVVARQIVDGLADLLYNRPSLMMQYSKRVFDILLQDHHQHMRLHVTQLIIKLVLGGVLRFKEGIGKLIYLLVDSVPQVRCRPSTDICYGALVFVPCH